MGEIKLSVVAPCYNEEAVLRDFHRRMSAACLAACGDSHEIVLVDDGSSDRTWPLIEELADADPHIVGVRLFRNHGHQLAVTAGLSIAKGSRVLLIDADLQDPPELLPQMMQIMDGGADVVYGQRASRSGETAFKLATASLFYRMLNRLSAVPIPRDTGDFRLMNRTVVDILRGMPEQHRFIRGMVSWIGGRQVAMPYAREPRFAGTTKYPLRKMVSFATDALTSFSTVPLQLAVWLGLMSAVFAFLILTYAVVQWMLGNVVPGWASSLVAISFFSGVQLVVMGVFGEYLGRVVQEVKRRPLFTIAAIRQAGVSTPLPADYYKMGAAEQGALLDTQLRKASC
ncbi:glycosyltransferase [Rhizobium rhizosphaerae]|uniref:Glycosyltransferase n=1 Tax=Xaviernesmea rhizosphaerae TaxID=1672749 RepID=A0A1Q9AEB0_9HYPH|nr:glycosyltransferase family 2 protein [Xaviernesmea rhizosphaerae]OLP53253.1 glycosyltransferase [Xaviernesmea rhizosphaerae]